MPAAAAQGGFTTENALPGLSFVQPVDVVVGAPGELFVVEKRGTIQRVRDGQRQAQPFLDLRSEVVAFGDRGLLGFALDPAFAQNGWVYALWSVEIVAGQNPDNRPTDVYGRLARFTVDPGTERVDPASRRTLLGASVADGIPACFYSHGPNTLRFGTDGTLLISTGDGAQYTRVDAGGDYQNCFGPDGFPEAEDIGSFRSQRLESLAGKILRVDPATGLGLPSNPFWTGDASDNASRVWALGLRNPYRFAVTGPGSPDPADADPGELTVGDVGWKVYEELNVVRGGENFGWPCREGPVAQPDGYLDTPPAATYCGAAFAGPNAWFHHTRDDLSFPQGLKANAIVAGDRDLGTAYPASVRGAVYHSDYTRGWVSAARFDGQGQLVSHQQVLTQAGPIVAMVYEPATEAMLLVDVGAGQIKRLVYDDGTGGTLPAGFVARDVGAVPVPGTTDAVGSAIRLAGGGDAWGDADGLHLFAKPLAAGGTLTARLAEVSGPDAWSKVGLTVRASDAPDAAHVSVYATPGAGRHVQLRAADGAVTQSLPLGDGSGAVWLRLTRDGDAVAAYTSADGQTWTLAASVTAALGTEVQAGLVASATDYTGTNALAVGVFESLSLEPAQTGGLPAPWASQDIGSVSAEGGATFSGDQFVVQGSGDVWGGADGFHFLHQTVTGDATIQAEIVRFAAPRAWAKAGPMIRGGLTDQAAHASLFATFEAGMHLQSRGEAGADTESAPALGQDVPVWLRLQRRGGTVRSATSTDGVAWTPGPEVAIGLPATAELGLAVTATDFENAGQIGIATFRNVQVTPGGTLRGELPWAESFDADGETRDDGDTAWTTARVGAPDAAVAVTDGGALALGASASGSLVWRSEAISLGDAARADLRLSLGGEGVGDADRLDLFARVDGGAPVAIGSYRGAAPARVALDGLTGSQVQIEAVAAVRTPGAAYRLDAVTVDAPVPVLPPAPERTVPAAPTLSVFPNPTRGTASVAFASALPEAARIAVVDVLGRVVLRREVAAGTVGVRVELGGLPSGVYGVRAVGAESRQAATARVTVIR